MSLINIRDGIRYWNQILRYSTLQHLQQEIEIMLGVT